MPRALSLPRLAARLAVVLPFAAFFQAACGGSDVIPFDSDGEAPDGAMMADGSMMMDSSLDSTADDGSMGDGTMGDGTVNDGTVNDGMSSDANDGSLVDGADASDAMDASDASDAMDASDGAVPQDAILKSAAIFAVFAGQTVTNANVTTITGDLGVYPSPTPIGTTPPVLLLGGSFHLGDGVAQTAQADILTAYTSLEPANLPGCIDLTGVHPDLGGVTLPPGIYCYSSSVGITGTLTLDSGGNPNAQWFFQIGSTLTTGSLGPLPAAVVVIGASPCNVYWQVGSTATISTGAIFSGNILAFSAITLTSHVSLAGRALGLAGASVTMDTDTVAITACPSVAIPFDGGVPLDAGLDASDASDGD